MVHIAFSKNWARIAEVWCQACGDLRLAPGVHAAVLCRA